MSLPVADVSWSMEEADIVSSVVSDGGELGIDGNLINSPTTGVATDRPDVEGIDFNGSNQLCQAAVSLLPSFSSFSAEFYMRPDGGDCIPVAIGVSTSGSYPFRGVFLQYMGDGRLGCAFEKGSSEQTLFTTKTTSLGQWLAAVLVWTGTTLKIHMMDNSGYQVVSAAATGLVLDALGHLRFGAYHPQFNNRYMNGVLSRCRLELNGKTLTDAQALEYMRQFFPVVTLSGQTPEPGSTVSQPVVVSCLVDDPGGDGIDLSSVVITATSDQGLETVYDGSSGGYQSGWSGSVSIGGTAGKLFSFSRDDVFPVETSGSVTVRVQATDSLDDGTNALDGSWSFSVSKSVSIVSSLEAQAVGGTVLNVSESTPGSLPDGLYIATVGLPGEDYVTALGTHPGSIPLGVVRALKGEFSIGVPSLNADEGYAIRLVSIDGLFVYDIADAFDVVPGPRYSSVYSLRARLPGAFMAGPRSVDSDS